MDIECPVRMCSSMYKQIQFQHDNSTYFEEQRIIEINEIINELLKSTVDTEKIKWLSIDEYISVSKIWQRIKIDPLKIEHN